MKICKKMNFMKMSVTIVLRSALDIRALQRKTSISLLFPGPKCRGGGGGQIAVAQHMNVNMCTCTSEFLDH